MDAPREWCFRERNLTGVAPPRRRQSGRQVRARGPLNHERIAALEPCACILDRARGDGRIDRHAVLLEGGQVGNLGEHSRERRRIAPDGSSSRRPQRRAPGGPPQSARRGARGARRPSPRRPHARRRLGSRPRARPERGEDAGARTPPSHACPVGRVSSGAPWPRRRRNPYGSPPRPQSRRRPWSARSPSPPSPPDGDRPRRSDQRQARSRRLHPGLVESPPASTSFA